MKLFKIISAYLGCLILFLGLSYPLWYSYSSLTLSFFLSTNSTATIETKAEYTNFDNQEFVQPFYLNTSVEPTLFHCTLKTNQLDRLK